MPFSGQMTSNHTKLSTPSRSPLDFGVHMPVDMSNGSFRRVASDHQILPTDCAAGQVLTENSASHPQHPISLHIIRRKIV